MGTVLSAYTESRDNNFNLMRFIAASAVLFSHSYPLALGAGAPEPAVRAIGMSAGSIAVDVFFVTSGFLVAGSLFRRNNLVAFVWARILRIYPALIVAVLFCIFVVGLFFTVEGIADYLSDPRTFTFFKRNSTLFWGVKYELPGVFEQLPFKGAINGSLWTLPYEVKMYAYLAAIAMGLALLQRRLQRSLLRAVFLLIALAAAGANVFNHFWPFASVHFVHLSAMFFFGVAYYLHRDRIRLSSRLILLLTAVLVIATQNRHAFFVSYVILLPYIVLYLAYVPRGAVRAFNRAGDYSYGMYIYAFPVQQSVVALAPGISVAGLTAAAFPVTLFLAVVSWHLLEARCLAMKGRYVTIERSLHGLGRRFKRMLG